MDLNSLQEQHREWLTANWPDQPQEIPAAGMVEEAGELLNCILAKRRGALWGFDPRYPVDRVQEKLIDAIGDCFIYVISYCNCPASIGWRIEDLDAVKTEIHHRPLVDVGVDLVMIAASFYKGRDRSQARLFIATIKAIATAYSIDFWRAVLTTWLKVKERKRC